MSKKLSKLQIEKRLKKDIPITKQLKFEIQRLNEKECILKANLKANINHKGTAFGGSQYSLCAVAAYAYVLNWLDQHQIKTENIVIADANIRYRRPVEHDFSVVAKLALNPKFEEIKNQDKKRISFFINCDVYDKKIKCTELTSRFIVQY